MLYAFIMRVPVRRRDKSIILQSARLVGYVAPGYEKSSHFVLHGSHNYLASSLINYRTWSTGKIQVSIQNASSPLPSMAEPGTDSQSIQIDDDSQNTKPSKPKATVERVPGRSVFPVARVQKILKADKVPMPGICKTGSS